MKYSLNKLLAKVVDASGTQMAERTLLRRFQRLITVCGGNFDDLKNDRGHIYFEDAEASFTEHILKQLIPSDGLPAQLIDKHSTDQYVGTGVVHEFIQGYLDQLANEGCAEPEIQQTLNFLSMIFCHPVHVMRDECHSLVDATYLNLQGYPYTHQCIEMKRFLTLLRQEFAHIAVQSTLMIGELAELIELSKTLCEDDVGAQSYADPDGEDDISMEYAARDQRALAMIQADDDLRNYVEKKLGKRAEEIFNVAAATQDQEE